MRTACVDTFDSYSVSSLATSSFMEKKRQPHLTDQFGLTFFDQYALRCLVFHSVVHDECARSPQTPIHDRRLGRRLCSCVDTVHHRDDVSSS